MEIDFVLLHQVDYAGVMDVHIWTIFKVPNLAKHAVLLIFANQKLGQMLAYPAGDRLISLDLDVSGIQPAKDADGQIFRTQTHCGDFFEA